MKRIFKSGACVIVGMLIVFMLAFLIMTPDKTSSGEYTNIWKYWTDDVYFNQNFK